MNPTNTTRDPEAADRLLEERQQFHGARATDAVVVRNLLADEMERWARLLRGIEDPAVAAAQLGNIGRSIEAHGHLLQMYAQQTQRSSVQGDVTMGAPYNQRETAGIGAIKEVVASIAGAIPKPPKRTRSGHDWRDLIALAKEGGATEDQLAALNQAMLADALGEESVALPNLRIPGTNIALPASYLDLSKAPDAPEAPEAEEGEPFAGLDAAVFAQEGDAPETRGPRTAGNPDDWLPAPGTHTRNRYGSSFGLGSLLDED